MQRLLLSGAAALALVGMACQGSEVFGDVRPATVTITPGDGAATLDPGTPIVVKVADGKLQNVSAPDIPGQTSPDGAQWQSRWPLAPDRTYEVTATAISRDGRIQTVRSAFRTLRPRRTVPAKVVAPSAGEEVGVGMPIILHFDAKITDKAQVERALEVRTSVPVEGAWRWFGDQDVVYRPRAYWPAQTKVELVGHLSGARTAAGAYGVRDLNLAFQVGDAHITTASARTHHQIVRSNGKVVRKIPISMGKATQLKYTTTSGTHLTLDKSYSVVMDSATVGCPPGCPEYYRHQVFWAVRISDSGEYEHSAPWSAAAQGRSNVSHGCVNMSPADARWFFNFTNRGDVVKVIGTKRRLDPQNGWGYWQLSWADWLAGSALSAPAVMG